jgi:hypothetical protein
MPDIRLHGSKPVVGSVVEADDVLNVGIKQPDGSYVDREIVIANLLANSLSTYQPLDSDLTAIAALSTTAFGRALLELADEAAFKAAVNLEIGTDVQGYDALLAGLAAVNPVADGDLLFASGANTFEKIATSADIETLLKSASFDAGGVIAKTGAQTKEGVLTLTDGLSFGNETLSAYRAASWTPAFTTSSPGTLSVSYTSQSGWYVRIGDLIYAYFLMQFTPTKGTATGSMKIAGFPVSVALGQLNCNNLNSAWDWPGTITVPFVTWIGTEGTMQGIAEGSTKQSFNVATMTDGVLHQITGVGVAHI